MPATFDHGSRDEPRDDRELLERIVETIPVMVTIYDPGTRVVRVNREFERVLGWSADDVVGTSLMEACYPDPEYRRRVGDFMSECSGRWMDVRMRARDGRFVETSWANIRLSDDRRLGIGIDIGERKASEQGLRELDRRKDEFVAMLAHELRNPLAPIRTAVGALRRDDSDPAVRERAYAILERQIGRMAQLVDDLLDLSRIRHGALPMRRERVTLSSLIAGVMESVRPGLASSGHEIAVTLPEGEVALDVDPARVEQALVNLVNNASAYSPAGSTIDVAAEVDEASAVLEIRDRGAGIDPAMLPRVFDMFSRGETSGERHPQGLGIGLALARTVVELHGGTIEVRSEVGAGSVFRIRLPRPGAGGS